MYGGYVLHLANKEALQNAKLELKKSKRKDYYKILGVDKQAGEDEIKKAYKKRALLHHPGKTNSYLPRKAEPLDLCLISFAPKNIAAPARVVT